MQMAVNMQTLESLMVCPPCFVDQVRAALEAKP